MSLRSIAAETAIHVSGEVKPTNGTALVFVLNKPFLIGLKTLAFSMIKQNTMLDLPVLIITDEPEVLADPFVSILADKTVLVSPEQISQFEGISSARIDDRVKLEWIPAYTFLKWLIFEDYGYDRLVWIDVDIVCLKPIDELTRLTYKALYAGGVFPSQLYRIGQDRLPLEDRERNILAFSDAPSPSDDSLNSGVMVINKPLLNKAFREELISHARERDFTNEQLVITRVLARPKYAGFGWLPPTYNYSHAYAMLAGASVQIDILAKVKLLHYIGVDGKPWNRPKGTRTTERLWWDFHLDATGTHTLFN